MPDDGERVEPWLLHHVRRLQRWQYGHTTHWAVRYITLGQLADGRWLVEHSDTTIGCWAYRSEERAQEEIRRHTAGREWREVPAAFGPDAKPIGDGWVRRGGSWARDPSITPDGR